VAISPELPDRALTMAQKNGLAFEVLSDVGNAVARQFGLVFPMPQSLRDVYAAFGNHRGAAYIEMPIPGTFVIDRHATIRLAHVDPDYTQRLEPADILETLQTLKGTAA